jgi:hypothetical protein
VIQRALHTAFCSARPIQNFFPGTTVAIVGVIWAHGTPQDGAWNRIRGLCVAVVQVVLRSKLKGRLRCDRSEETEDFNFKRFSR